MTAQDVRAIEGEDIVIVPAKRLSNSKIDPDEHVMGTVEQTDACAGKNMVYKKHTNKQDGM